MPAKLQERKSFQAHNFKSTLLGQKKLKFQEFANFNAGSVGMFVAIEGTSPWEYHPDSDEFLQVLEGSADIEVLTDSDSIVTRVEAGHCFVVPKAHWHRHIVKGYLRELFVTPGTTDHSNAEDPRMDKKPKTRLAPAKPARDLIDEIREFAFTFPEVREDHPWGYPAFKVKGKTFAALSFQEHGNRLTVKLTHSRLEALSLPFVEPSGFGLGEHGWITAELSRENRLPLDVIKRWVAESFHAVAPKTLLKELDKDTVSSPRKRTVPKRRR